MRLIWKSYFRLMARREIGEESLDKCSLDAYAITNMQIFISLSLCRAHVYVNSVKCESSVVHNPMS